ncbi:glycosyltransferase family 50 protein [Sanghuangporus baumii]|uniref:GPI mannosyltransferase 1 n=1 Tax=Sanghuangporus baumii TaxID=108892 RepID=A0A9Q5I192_SANBA|nr:glycosyltransferase family 50 protein [Sanghuangporus baumii]
MKLSSLQNVSFRTVIILSILLRVALVFYSEWHDKHAVVKYTDIDYRVFTDAARFLLQPNGSTSDDGRGKNIAQGALGKYFGFGDPYYCETYRYTPLLALVMTPNIFLHPTFGKYLFSACDILVGVLIYKLLLATVLPNTSPGSTNAERERQATFYASLHLLNPMVFSISTRGSSESTLGALVIGTLYLAMRPGKSQRDWDKTAIMLGIATHWKIYPLIYGVSLVSVMAFESGSGYSFKSWSRNLASRQAIRFTIISAGTFMLLNGIMYLFWGHPFLYETYLYHIHRLDHQHNFSPYWLPMKLAYEHPRKSALWQRFMKSPFASFLPQMALSLGSGLVYGARGTRHLPFTWFVQTAWFVTLNKVCTSQYFLWYLTILPLILPSLLASRSKAVVMIALWASAQAAWLKFAYDLEFLKQDVQYRVWACSVLFFIVNCWEIWEIVRAYQWTSSKDEERREGRRDI